LLASSGEWLPALAVVRAEREEVGTFRDVFAEVMRRLEPLRHSERLRWEDLMWFLVSWAYRRRPGEEKKDLVATATARLDSVAVKEEVEKMSTKVEQTWEQELLQRGDSRGSLRTAREFLRDLLEDSFGPLPEAWAQRIESIEDVELLRRWGRRVKHIKSLDELDK
jgi:hypothetical protein